MPHVITTPGGYKIEVKEKLTYEDRRELQKAMLDRVRYTVDIRGRRIPEPISASVIMEVQEIALRRSLVSIIRPDGSLVEGYLYDYLVNDVDDEDVDFIFSEIDRLYSPMSLGRKSKKKEIKS